MPLQVNAKGKQHFLMCHQWFDLNQVVYDQCFKSAEAAATLHMGFCGLMLKHTLLQNSLVSLATYLQQTTRGSCRDGQFCIITSARHTLAMVYTSEHPLRLIRCFLTPGMVGAATALELAWARDGVCTGARRKVTRRLP